ncbi:hypothetical protein [Joostella sp. CR20]|uniref:hypothetical protein n=1 Tax=Joostella sp. CR20 TaxID=2804312 RepID=UPI00313F3566
MTKIEERINIAISIKSNYGERKKGIDRQIQNLKWLITMNVVLSILFIGFIFASIFFEPLGLKVFQWHKMGLMVVFLPMFLMRIPNDIFELKLLNHSKKISGSKDFTALDTLNIDLASFIRKQNNQIKSAPVWFALTLFLLLAGVFQTINQEVNVYWSYVKIPVVLYILLFVIRFFMLNKKLNKNIQQVEEKLTTI